MSDTYKVTRFSMKGGRRVIHTGLTREEAKRICNDPQTCSETATGTRARRLTERIGRWFYGFDKE